MVLSAITAMVPAMPHCRGADGGTPPFFVLFLKSLLRVNFILKTYQAPISLLVFAPSLVKAWNLGFHMSSLLWTSWALASFSNEQIWQPITSSFHFFLFPCLFFTCSFLQMFLISFSLFFFFLVWLFLFFISSMFLCSVFSKFQNLVLFFRISESCSMFFLKPIMFPILFHLKDNLKHPKSNSFKTCDVFLDFSL